MTRRRFATVLAGVAVVSLFFVPDTRWPWLLLPAGVALVAAAVYVVGRGDEVSADAGSLADAERMVALLERQRAELDDALDDLVVEAVDIASSLGLVAVAYPDARGDIERHVGRLRIALKRAMGNEPAPRECPACPHQRIEHSGYGCDRCDCRVNIIDLTPLPVWEVPFR